MATINFYEDDAGSLYMEDPAETSNEFAMLTLEVSEEEFRQISTAYILLEKYLDQANKVQKEKDLESRLIDLKKAQDKCNSCKYCLESKGCTHPDTRMAKFSCSDWSIYTRILCQYFLLKEESK